MIKLRCLEMKSEEENPLQFFFLLCSQIIGK